MSINPERPEHLFIVRVWQERAQVRPGTWRGSVEHIPSGQRLYFVSLIDLNDFIRLRLAFPPENAADQLEARKS